MASSAKKTRTRNARNRERHEGAASRTARLGGSSAAGSQSFAWSDWLVAAALVAAVFLVYMPCWHGGFLWDDENHLLNNPVLKAGGLAKIWVPGGYLNYWPLTFTVYWLQFHLWGLQPLGFHLVNLALHACSAVLVWQVLVRLHVPGALFAAALFALHPVNVETAAWIAHLKDVMSLALALASMLFYLDSERHQSRWRYCLAILAFFLSALAKGTAITLPFVLLARAWWQRGRIGRRDLQRVLPYFLIGAAMACVEVWTQHHVAGQDVVRTDDFFSRAAVAGCALWFYLGKLILPINLCPFYPRWTIDERSVISYLPGAMWMIALALAWWKRRAWGRPVVMSMVCYTALLLPVLGFVNIYFMRYSLVSDHWQYIASIVPCAALAAMTALLARRFVYWPAAISAAVVMLIAMAVLSCRQSGIYASSEIFYEAVLARNPDCWLVQYNFGNLLGGRGQVASAIFHYQKALAIRPDYAEAHNNLGNLLLAGGHSESAIAHFEKAVESKPDFAEAYYNLGNALIGRGQITSAIAAYQSAVEFDPAHAEAHNNLGNALLRRGEIESAIAQYRMALEDKPDYPAARQNLAIALSKRGKVQKAPAEKRQSIRLQPD